MWYNQDVCKMGIRVRTDLLTFNTVWMCGDLGRLYWEGNYKRREMGILRITNDSVDLYLS